MSATPVVSTHGGSQAFSRARGVSFRGSHCSGLGPAPGAYCTVVSESGRVGSSSLRVDRLVTSDCRSSCRVVETGASPRQQGVFRLPSILSHSSDRGVCCGHYMKSIYKAAKLALLPDGYAKCVDLWVSVGR